MCIMNKLSYCDGLNGGFPYEAILSQIGRLVIFNNFITLEEL